MTSLQLAIDQIRFSREYTMTLLDQIPADHWFTIPASGHTNIAWQVGHLAMAQYGLCLFRIRGREEADLDLMSSSFRKKYSRGTTPNPDPSRNPSVAEIRAVFERVNEQANLEMPNYSDDVLAEQVDPPYAAIPTKLGCLLFCSHHEMIHAGQIGMIRRQLGLEPVR